MSLNKLVEHQRFKCGLRPDAQPQPVLAREARSGRGGPAIPQGCEGPPAPQEGSPALQEGSPAPQESLLAPHNGPPAPQQVALTPILGPLDPPTPETEPPSKHPVATEVS